jgi:hypothetical protein
VEHCEKAEAFATVLECHRFTGVTRVWAWGAALAAPAPAPYGTSRSLPSRTEPKVNGGYWWSM